MRAKSSRCSEVVTVAAAVAASLLLVSAALPAAAVSVGGTDVPDAAEVGTETTASVRLTDLYRDPNLESWTLTGRTALADVTWTVTFYDQGGNQIDRQSHDGQSFTQDGIDLDAGVSTVVVNVTGTVPPVDAYSYQPPQAFEVMALTQTRPGGSSNAIDAWSVHHYTAESRNARQRIDAARRAIQDARQRGANPTEAENTLQNAVDAFESGNFDLAVTLANQARQQAEAAGAATQRRQLLLYAGAGLLVLAAVAAGAYWYRSRERPYDRLG